MADEHGDRPVNGACPSSACRPGAVLLGVVLPDGRIAYLDERLTVDREFVRIAHQGRAPEERFRFSSPCMGNGCRQWDGRECGLIDRLIADYEGQFGKAEIPDPIPDCPIRAECRWFGQRGGVSCTVCNVLVTDMARPDSELPPEVLARRALYGAGVERR